VLASWAATFLGIHGRNYITAPIVRQNDRPLLAVSRPLHPTQSGPQLRSRSLFGVRVPPRVAAGHALVDPNWEPHRPLLRHVLDKTRGVAFIDEAR
jgi:hypothetical protein